MFPLSPVGRGCLNHPFISFSFGEKVAARPDEGVLRAIQFWFEAAVGSGTPF